MHRPVLYANVTAYSSDAYSAVQWTMCSTCCVLLGHSVPECCSFLCPMNTEYGGTNILSRTSFFASVSSTVLKRSQTGENLEKRTVHHLLPWVDAFNRPGESFIRDLRSYAGLEPLINVLTEITTHLWQSRRSYASLHCPGHNAAAPIQCTHNDPYERQRTCCLRGLPGTPSKVRSLRSTLPSAYSTVAWPPPLIHYWWPCSKGPWRFQTCCISTRWPYLQQRWTNHPRRDEVHCLSAS